MVMAQEVQIEEFDKPLSELLAKLASRSRTSLDGTGARRWFEYVTLLWSQLPVSSLGYRLQGLARYSNATIQQFSMRLRSTTSAYLKMGHTEFVKASEALRMMVGKNTKLIREYNMNILNVFSDKSASPYKGEGRVTEVKGKRHRLSHQNGLIELSFNLAPDQRASFDAKSSAIEAAMHKAVSSSTDTLNAKIAEAKREAEGAVTKARAKYDADLFALFAEFGKIPSREALITNDTPVGHVVRLPESAIVPQAKAVVG